MAEPITEETAQDLRDGINALNRTLGGGDSGNTKKVPSTATPAAQTDPAAVHSKTGQPSAPTNSLNLNALGGIIDRIVVALEKLAVGVDATVKKFTGFGFDDAGTAVAGLASSRSLDDPSATFNKASKDLAAKMGFLGTAIATAITTIDAASERAYAANKLGGQGQGDPYKLQSDVQKAGFKNVESFLEFMKSDQARKSLSGSGISADESSQKFNQYSAELAKKLQPLIDKGEIKREDIPKFAAYGAAGKTNQLDTDASREKLAQETSDFVIQLQKQSRAYGLNRDAVMASNQAHNESAEEQLRQQFLGDDIQRDQMRRNRDLATGMGSSFQDAMSKIYAGQQLTAKDQAILQMGTGNRTGELQAAIRETKRTAGLAADDPIRIKAEKELEKRLAEGNRYQSSREFAQIGMTTTDPEIKNAVLELQALNQTKGAQAKATQGPGGTTLTPMQARAEIEKRQQMLEANKRYDIPTEGQKGGYSDNTGAAIAASLRPVQDAYARNTIALSGSISLLMTELGKNTKAIEAFQTKLTLPLNVMEGGSTKQSIADRMTANQDLIDKLRGLFLEGMKGSDSGNAANPAGATTPKPSVAPNNNQRINPVKEPATINAPGANNVNINNPASVTLNSPATPQVASPSVAPEGNQRVNPVKATRAHGTFGETGLAIEPKDVIAQLHKGETVLSTTQVSNLANINRSPVNSAATNTPKIDKSTGTVKPVEAASNNFNALYDAVFKGTLDGNMAKPIAGVQISTVPALPAVNVPAINVPAAIVNMPALPAVNVPAIPAPKVGVKLPDVNVLNSTVPNTKLFNIDTLLSNMFGKLDTSNKVLANNNDSSNKETSKQNTKQSISISSIFDSISSKISPVKPVISSDNTNSDLSIIDKSLTNETSKSDTELLNGKKIVDTIRSKLSLVTGGGSTTQTSVQNEDAKALEDRLKVASTSLNSRIGAGTSTQTSFESGITKSQLVVKEPPSISISEGMKGYNSILGEATVDEGDEEPQPINLNDSEPNTKDLHEQLIQLNTSIRQLVEHSADGLDKADALRRTTSSLSGNRFA